MSRKTDIGHRLRSFRNRLVSRGDSPYSREAFEVLASIRSWRDDDIVLDVGANDGRTVRRLRRHLPAKPRIIAFEPVRTTFEALMEEAGKYTNVECHRLGVSNENGERTIYHGQQPVLASLSADWSEGTSEETIDVVTLDAFAEEADIGAAALLKIDVEGHDLAVLQGARGMIERGAIELILIETTIDVDRPGAHLREVQEELAGSGYRLVEMLNQSHAHRTPDRFRRLAYADALFARP